MKTPSPCLRQTASRGRDQTRVLVNGKSPGPPNRPYLDPPLHAIDSVPTKHLQKQTHVTVVKLDECECCTTAQ